MKYAYKIRLILAGIVLLLTISAFYKFYPVRFLDMQFGALFQRVISDFSVPAVFLICLLLLSAVLFGRIYCSLICPFGILQEFFNLIYSKIKAKKLPEIKYCKNKPYKYFIMALSFGCLIGASAYFIRLFDPYTVFGSALTLTKYGIIFTLIVLVLVFFKNRFFCSSICPVGAVLGLLSKIAPFKIYMDDNCIKCGMCARYCPVGAINKDEKEVNNENCVKCLKCTSICPQGAMRYGFKLKPVKFNLNKRKSLVSLGVLGVFTGAIMAGLKFSKDLYSKFKDIILPAGAKDAETMANKCLNCNLCVNNCPKGILAKADKEYPAIHIDFEKGKHYCAYKCHKCSEVCPSGAIKKISLEQKQNTRIAIASINSYCIGCNKCVLKCPKGAITINNGSAKIDGLKCIGCGLCKAVCPMSAVEIYPVKKQAEI